MLPASVQRFLPQHGLSRLAGRLAESRRVVIAQSLIRAFARVYGVDLSEAARVKAADYVCFNDFFTRELAPGRRPLPPDPDLLVAPADGTISALGTVDEGTLLQAKGIRYPLATLLGDADSAARFTGGSFVTIYLAPRDYHRVHAPASGRLRTSRAIPGALFSVNARTEAALPELFCRNERLVLELDATFGPLALVMVGALVVASIETPFGTPTSPFRRRVDCAHDAIVARGMEAGRFLAGSTVIVVWPGGVADLLTDLESGARVRMGEPLARIRRARSGTA
jgi:phosphatidylserine decarboxylase